MAKGLYKDEAIQLFSWKAFGRDNPTEDYEEFSKRFVHFAGGLPLAVQVVGSFLCSRTTNDWRCALERMEEFPEQKTLRIFKISYDGLQETERKIFLDIACFFKSKNIVCINDILNRCGLS